jgi:hypothetical protein
MRKWILAVLFVAGQAKADVSFISGNDLMKMNDNNLGLYVVAVSDTVNFYSSTLKGNAGGYCMPFDVAVGQLSAVVKNFLNANPQKWHQSATSLVVRAYQTSFPCK